MRDEGLNTMVAGVRCRDVLTELSDFLDGALSAHRVAVLQAHLAGCDRCARFGADVSAVLTALRAGASEAPALSALSSERLHARLTAVMQE